MCTICHERKYRWWVPNLGHDHGRRHSWTPHVIHHGQGMYNLLLQIEYFALKNTRSCVMNSSDEDELDDESLTGGLRHIVTPESGDVARIWGEVDPSGLALACCSPGSWGKKFCMSWTDITWCEERTRGSQSGLCVRSWLSGNLGKTALRLIEINRMYFDTSLKTSRRD